MIEAKIFGRAWIRADATPEIDVWEQAFVPMEPMKRSCAEWALEHLAMFCEGHLRELLEVPAEGDFQVLFEGTMKGWHYNNQEGEEFDEEFEVTKSEHRPIPEGF